MDVTKFCFIYCFLTWMLSSSKSNKLINKVHERSLTTISDCKQNVFEILLEIENYALKKLPQIQKSLMGALKQLWKTFLCFVKARLA